MSVPRSSSATRGFASRRRASDRASDANPGLRVSDAERAEVADRLAKHYSDGRLDQAEFDKRLDQAMRAVTQSDLSGLFADLPSGGTPEAVARRQNVRPHRPYRRMAAVPRTGRRARTRPPCRGPAACRAAAPTRPLTVGRPPVDRWSALF